MLRNLILCLSFACLLSLGAMTIGCGSSSKSTTTCTGGPYNVVGDWNLTLNGAAGVAGVINSTGEGAFFDSLGDVIVIPNITGACSFSATASEYTSSLGNPPNSSGSATVTGNVNSATSISGSYTSGSSNGTFSAAPITPLSGSPTLPTTTMYAEVEAATTPDILQLTFSGTASSMTLSGADGFDTCTASGTLTEEGTNNVFAASITFSGTTCSVTGTVTGLGLESNSDYFSMNGRAAGTYLYVVSSDSATVIEIYPPGT